MCYRKNGGNCRCGDYKPDPEEGTAHKQLWKDHGSKKMKHYIGGSIKQDGSIGMNSGTLNKQHYGSRTATGKAAQKMKTNLANNNYKQVQNHKK